MAILSRKSNVDRLNVPSRYADTSNTRFSSASLAYMSPPAAFFSPKSRRLGSPESTVRNETSNFGSASPYSARSAGCSLTTRWISRDARLLVKLVSSLSSALSFSGAVTSHV